MSGALMLARIDQWWRAPAPASRLALVRAVVGLYCFVLLLVRVPSIARLARFEAARFEPVGVVGLLDAPLPPALAMLLFGLALVGAGAFALGWRYRVTAPVFALALLWVLSYRNSWGHMSHSEHLVVIHVLTLSLVPAADAVSLDAHAGRTRETDEVRYGWPLRLLMVTVAISYMLAGWAKVNLGGWAWVHGEAVHHQIANDALRKLRFGDRSSPMSGLILRQPWVFGAVAAFTLVVELGALVALREGKPRYAWIAGAWLMHVGIVIAMGIGFPYPLSGAAFASFLPLERGLAQVRRWRAR